MLASNWREKQGRLLVVITASFPMEWGSTEAIAGVTDVFSLRNDGLRIASCVREVLFVGVLAGTEEKSFHPKNTKSFGLY